MTTRYRRFSGFSLVELMIGTALGMFVILGAISATTRLMKGESLALAKLDNELRNSSDFLERDIRRSGYDGLASLRLSQGVDAYPSPFSILDVDIKGCVRYSYDANSNGMLDESGTDERYAIALSNGVLYLRSGGVDFDCNTSSGVWQPLTDPSLVKISDFSASVQDTPYVVPGTNKKLHVRSFSYSITGNLVKQEAVQQTASGSVRLPNDTLW